MRIFCQQTILMKYHALFVIFEKAAKFELRVNPLHAERPNLWNSVFLSAIELGLILMQLCLDWKMSNFVTSHPVTYCSNLISFIMNWQGASVSDELTQKLLFLYQSLICSSTHQMNRYVPIY